MEILVDGRARCVAQVDVATQGAKFLVVLDVEEEGGRRPLTLRLDFLDVVDLQERLNKALATAVRNDRAARAKRAGGTA